MASARIFTEQTLTAGTTLELEDFAARHVGGALRLGGGDSITLFNGTGGEYRAVIESADRKRVVVSVARFIERDVESTLALHLGIVMSRGERMDWVMQKATELGVAFITPLTSERCEVRLKGERASKKSQHWRQIIRSACEQCGRNRLPQLQPIASVADWLANCSAELKLVLHHRSENSALAGPTPASIDLLIGPEGGLSETEIELAQSHGLQPLALGPRVLRTETAPLAALAILQARWGDMLSNHDKEPSE